MQSEQIDKLVEALAKAQSEMTNPVFDRRNPHFNSRYASEAAIMDAVRGPLSKYGLALSHQTVNGVLVTKIMHGNQWLATEWALAVTSGKPQERGSELTYGRRYNICGLVGVVGDTDDDAEEASKAPTKVIERVTPPSKAAEALIDIAKQHDPEPEYTKPEQLADDIAASKFDWKAFGEQLIELARQGATRTPDQQALFEKMMVDKPKSYNNLVKALKAVTPKEPAQPKPEDDPDAYRVWLIDQMSRFDSTASLQAHMKEQQALWVGEKVFPPDIDDWTELYKERAAELGK